MCMDDIQGCSLIGRHQIFAKTITSMKMTGKHYGKHYVKKYNNMQINQKIAIKKKINKKYNKKRNYLIECHQ